MELSYELNSEGVLEFKLDLTQGELHQLQELSNIALASPMAAAHKEIAEKLNECYLQMFAEIAQQTLTRKEE